MKHSQKVARKWKTQGDGIKGEIVQIYVSWSKRYLKVEEVLNRTKKAEGEE